jgi:uncharacterized OB-fold protein
MECYDTNNGGDIIDIEPDICDTCGAVVIPIDGDICPLCGRWVEIEDPTYIDG